MEAKVKKYCKKMLPLVSRTFALGISLLKEPVEIQVGVGYLICRITDTIEDTAEVSSDVKSKLLKNVAHNLCKKDRQEVLDGIKKVFPLTQFKGDEYELLHNTNLVMQCFDTFSKEARAIIEKCVLDMASGMAETVCKEENGKLNGLKNIEELKEYCYYVAGTVGELLTKLFVLDRKTITPKIHQKLKEREVDFGLGLQMTNILKGIFDDYKRGVVFLPLTLLKQNNFTIETFFKNPNQPDGKQLILDFVEIIRPYMDRAIEYTFYIPEKEKDIRLFCSLPVLFALRTLKLAKENPYLLLKDKPLKISRQEVKDLYKQTKKIVADNKKLLELFEFEKKF